MERKSIDDNFAAKRSPSGAAVMRKSVTDALTRAFFEEWAQKGYGALSLEAVAKRAGVGKAALYRRWSSKHEMAIQLIKTVGLDLTPIPDSGTLIEDLRLILLSLRRTLRHRLIRRILPDLHAEMARSSALSAEIRSTLQYERRERGKVIVDRAITRGELPKDTDRDLANDALASILYWRIIVTGGSVSSTEIDKIAQFIAAGLASDQTFESESSRP
ncbi:TetR/AcrR family transcriptional regulator [Pelagibius litoralis]|uniref:TetR/AcrR family transcriptional regulator n=1 Tax=Pelagibius litoralis TaxID=374515 RepID=A0A967F1Y8_9PROT|nr:TetR/AcrR family transcriptional regulator [Pelagibius litoralis]NIA71436.1 TetR/AcrR family transcriptional regulator [Pelagibius litoralis]